MMNYQTDDEMYICFIFELLRSISRDFDEKDALQERKDLAMKMTKLAIKDFKHQQHLSKKKDYVVRFSFTECKDRVLKLKTLLTIISKFDVGHQDGRYFCSEFPHGFLNMLEYFNIGE